MPGCQLDAAVFSGLYFEALDEELVSLCPPINTHRHASAPKVEELEEDTQTAEGPTEMGERDYTVRQLLFLWTRLGFADVYSTGYEGRVAHLAHIWWEISFCEHQTSMTSSPLEIGDYANATF